MGFTLKLVFIIKAELSFSIITYIYKYLMLLLRRLRSCFLSLDRKLSNRLSLILSFLPPCPNNVEDYHDYYNCTSHTQAYDSANFWRRLRASKGLNLSIILIIHEGLWNARLCSDAVANLFFEAAAIVKIIIPNFSWVCSIVTEQRAQRLRGAIGTTHGLEICFLGTWALNPERFKLASLSELQLGADSYGSLDDLIDDSIFGIFAFFAKSVY